ncbi:MAG: Wzz/FepE/Etk N-terminal domain-containing protein, partial [Gammaproteobacteria bacterium]|nr:Wzz/FepE/Etk N-terminal domain-containing protein [Gammaproteobacteria bacterium]
MSTPTPHPTIQDYESADVSLRDIVTVLFRRLTGMTVIFTIAMIIALFWIFTIRADVYEATAKILVRVGHEQLNSVTVLDRQSPVIGYRHQDVATEVHILSSTDILERVVDQLKLEEMGEKVRPEGFLKGLVHDFRQILASVEEWTNEFMIRIGLRQRLSPRQQIINTLGKGLRVGSSQESNILVAQLRLPFREGTAAVLNSILTTYLESRMSYFQEEDAVNLFRARMNKALKELRMVEAQIKKLETDSNIVNLEVQEKLLLEQEEQLAAQVKTDELEFEILKGKVNNLKAATGSDEMNIGLLGAFPNDSFASDLMTQLAQLGNDRIQIEMASSSEQRTIDEINLRYKRTLDLLETNIESMYDEKLAALNGRREALDAVRDELKRLHENENTWRNLIRKSELLETDYKFYRHEVEEASVTSSMRTNRISTVKIIQRPTDSLQPAGIRKLYLIYIAIVLSGFIAIC